MTTDENYHVLKLQDVASWQVPNLPSSPPPIEARIPSLQRGAVWKPQQIEMLWDSIFRGFPIGSIVVSKQIEGQKDKEQVIDNSPDSQKTVDKTTHHILDGQQRCNAIAWGFVDPTDEKLSDDIVLWLDLQPKERLKNSVRKYLFRVTTKAHPWGFVGHDDELKYLSSSKIRDAMKGIGTEDSKKPTPRNSFPHDAGLPIPVSFLIKYFKFEKSEIDLSQLIQDENVKKLKNYSEKEITKLSPEDINCLNNGLKNLFNTRIVALQVPHGTEKAIDDIEQIFSRLNTQGTKLDPEELAYSTIKAYWPDVEEEISSLEDSLRHCTETRLVSLGVRVALTKMDHDKKISAQQSSEQIRDIFKLNEKNKSIIITEFFQKDLSRSLKWIDDNLLYSKDRTYGLPKYLRSSIAWHSRDVFAWLMLLAKKSEFETIDDKQRKKIIGIALTIHWFGKDKIDAVNFLLENGLEKVTISEIKDEKARKTFIYTPITPHDMDKELQLNNETNEDQLKNWKNFWNGVIVYDSKNIKYSENDQETRRNEYGLFMGRLHKERELLIYAQRDYIETQFNDFDPSNKLMWEGFNRPWDYDHILPSNRIGGTGNKEKKYTKTCQAWQQSIGNLTAVDFAFNRAAQDKVNAKEKYGIKKDDGFDIFTENLPSFVIDHDGTNDFEKSIKFVLAAKERLITVYKKWYETLEIGGIKDITS